MNVASLVIANFYDDKKKKYFLACGIKNYAQNSRLDH